MSRLPEKVIAHSNFRRMKPINIVKQIVGNDNSYLVSYPDAANLNMFSVSRLAWNWKQLVDIKAQVIDLQTEWNSKMLVGRILGHEVQNQFVMNDERWFSEHEVRYKIPFKWEHNDLQDITLMGHIDLINFDTNELIELKTSVMSNKIYDYSKFQAALYWAAIKRNTGFDFTTSVIKVSVPPRQEFLSKEQKIEGAQEIIRRAYLVAHELDRKKRKQ